MTSWKPIVDGLWALERRMGGAVLVRSTALRLEDGTSLVISPIRESTDEALEEWRAGAGDETSTVRRSRAMMIARQRSVRFFPRDLRIWPLGLSRGK